MSPAQPHGGAPSTWKASQPQQPPPAARGNSHLFTVAAERVTRLYKSPDRNNFCLAANAVTAMYREQEAEVARAQHRG